MDAIHNFSDELALVCLYLAFVLARGFSRNLLRVANLFNSVGIVAISGLLLWQAVVRLLHPAPVLGAVSIPVGLFAAIGNWGVAKLLYEPGKDNAAIRLAYLHNLGDIQVSLAPCLSGVLVLLTGRPYFDPILAGGIAIWLIGSTLPEVMRSSDELLWPTKTDCGHG